ncbi:hypothetical protein [Bacillus sp. 1P06AnD]|uniref:hypothetical protein n=1 Tax=Bacillus sp. 1P06AnD TaxID=3132208 RepID=UPI0039A2C457
MSKPKIMKVSYGEEMPEQTALLFYRILEKLIISSLPNDPQRVGLFLQDSLLEFTNEINEEET